MARIVLPIAGAVVGAFFGNPALGFAIGSALGSIVDPLKVNGPGIGDLQVQTGRENVPRPIVYGTAAVAGNLIFSGTPVVTRRKAAGGGKGAPKVTESRQSLTFAIRIAEGPISGILRIWEDEKLVYDVRPSPEIPAADTAAFAAGINIHLGDETQVPDAAIEAEVGVDIAPYHRGSAYVVFVAKDLTDQGGRIPQYRFELSAGIALVPASLTIELFTIPSMFTETLSRANGRFFSIKGFPFETNNVRMSIDGVSWQDGIVVSDIIAGQNDSQIVFAFGKWRTVSTTRRVKESADGILWLDVGPHPQTNGSPQNGAMFNGNWYTFWADGTDRIVWVFDGLSWLNIGNIVASAAAGTAFRRLVSNGTAFVGISSSAVDGSDRLVRSTDSLNWVDVATSEMELLAWFGTSGSAIAVNESDGSFIHALKTKASEIDDYAFFRSTDGGLTWINMGMTVELTPEQDAGNPFNLFAIGDENWVFGELGGADLKYAPTPIGTGVRTLAPGEPMQLELIVSDIADRAQIAASAVDTLQLSGAVTGYVLGGFFTAAAALEPLRSGHFFDVAAWDGILRFVPRGAASVATITDDDMIGDPEENRRGQSAEFPRKIHLEYQNATIGYAPAKHTAERITPDVRVAGEIGATTSEVLTASESARRANVMLKIVWVEADGQVKIAVPDSMSWLTPTDIITLSTRGVQRRLRIESIDNADGILSLTCKRDRISALQSDAVGLVIEPPRPPASTNPGVTEWHWLNIPALIDSDDRLGGYFASAGSSEGWLGAVLQRSTDAGATYADTVINTGAVIGVLLDPLPSAPAEFTDARNVIRVSLVNLADSLETVTNAQMLAERNGIAIGGPAGWELLQFQTAVEESPGVWALSTLLRGRLNTDPLDHLAGAAFVELSGVSFVDNQIAHIGAPLTHRGVGINAPPEAATVDTQTYQPARTQYEWAPDHLLATINGSTLSASWIPRHRFGTPINPVASANFIGWRVTITDGANSIVAEPTTAQAQADISALSLPITVSVAALNRITGQGESADVVLN